MSNKDHLAQMCAANAVELARPPTLLSYDNSATVSKASKEEAIKILDLLSINS